MCGIGRGGRRDGKWQNIDGARVVPGDLVMLAAGAAVPADCWVNEGEIEVCHPHPAFPL